jgi:hypothetical protein
MEVCVVHAKFYQRMQPDLTAYVQASIDAVEGKFHPETGHYGTLHYHGCADRARAEEIKRALYRAAGYLKVSMHAKIVPQSDGTFRVEYKAIDKESARRYVKAKYGDDTSKWPYYKGGAI